MFARESSAQASDIQAGEIFQPRLKLLLGFAAFRLYPLASGLLTPVPGFHDIVVGCNGLYCATPEWDYTTGLGTFDVGKINSLLSP